MASKTGDASLDGIVQQILDRIAGENGFQEPEFEVKLATKPGDNYGGRVFRAIISEREKGGKKPLSLIFKTAPLSENLRSAYRSGVVYRNESNMYQVVLPKLNSFVEELGLSDSLTFPTARCLCSKISEDVHENALDIIVLEDMCAKGYGTVDRAQGLDADKCRVILRQLARLHAASMALRHLRPDEAQKLEVNVEEIFLKEGNPSVDEFGPIFKSGINWIEDRYPPGSTEHNKMKDLLDNYPENTFDLVRRDAESCILHGDCWTNNILFKFDKEDRVQDICFIDFQCSRVASPVCDLSYLLFTCTLKKTRDTHFISLLHDYHDELSSALKAMGCDPEKIFPWSMFQDHLKKFTRFGLLMAMIVVPLFLAESSEAVEDMDAAIDDGKSIEDIFSRHDMSRKGECKERISDILLDLINYGYL